MKALALARPGAGVQRVAPPLTLYVHIPWCLRKCPYCDFNSHALDAAAPLPEDAYVDALIADLESTLPAIWGRPVHAVFLGGGTPSLLSGAAVDRLLAAVRARLALVPDCEITLEANPGSFEAGRYADYRRAGVTRLSVGVQSFDDARLHALGRVHDAAQAVRAVETALKEFARVNLDLMIGLPGQDRAAAQRDIDTALALGPGHLSVYQLTIEPNTVFHKRPPPLPDEDTAAAISACAEEALARGGYRHYEISAWARAGAECRHNLNYWTFGDYLGIGAGAHAKLTLGDRIVREERARLPASYLARARAGTFVASTRTLDPADTVFEFMLNALRLVEGVPLALYTERTGRPVEALLPRIERACARGLLAFDGLRLRPSALGLRFLNDLQEMFLPEEGEVPPAERGGGDWSDIGAISP